MKHLITLGTLFFIFVPLSIKTMDGDAQLKTNDKSKKIFPFRVKDNYKEGIAQKGNILVAALARTLFTIKNGTSVSIVNTRATTNYVSGALFISMFNSLNGISSEDSNPVLDITDFIEKAQKPIREFYLSEIKELKKQNTEKERSNEEKIADLTLSMQKSQEDYTSLLNKRDTHDAVKSTEIEKELRSIIEGLRQEKKDLESQTVQIGLEKTQSEQSLNEANHIKTTNLLEQINQFKQNYYSRNAMVALGAFSLIAGTAIPTVIVPSIKHLLARYFLK